MKNNLGTMYSVGIAAFVIFLSTLIGVPVLPQLSKDLGAGAIGIPIVVSAALATVVIAQFFTGILADRYSSYSNMLQDLQRYKATSCLIGGHLQY